MMHLDKRWHVKKYYLTGEKQYKFEEMLPIYAVMSKETDVGTYADFIEAFKTFDREGQGFISSAELRHVLTAMGKVSHSV